MLYGPFCVHPLLDLFSETSGMDFDFLVESVRESGVRTPILVDAEGRTILHGRARVRATIAAGRDPNLIPRTLLRASVRHEAVLDLILRHQRQNSDFEHQLLLAAMPFYEQAAARRARFTPSGLSLPTQRSSGGCG